MPIQEQPQKGKPFEAASEFSSFYAEKIYIQIYKCHKAMQDSREGKT